MILSLFITAALVVLVAFFAVDSRRAGEMPTEKREMWEKAISNERSAVGRILLQVARPVSRSRIIANESATPQWRALKRKLAASGSFSSDVEMFLSVQVACTAVGLMVAAFTAASDSRNTLIGGLLFAFGIFAYPWNIVSKGAAKRTSEVLDNLPDFAELLQMPLAAGMGIPPALRFTADRLTGPVAEEVSRMLDVIRINPSEESSAFVEAGERLGVPEARAFFTALLQSHTEGASVSANLARQAEMLRSASFQRKRAELKKLPVKLVLIIGMHFLPALFILVLLPTALSLGGM
jgi:Flp pilus assembly protein TadB